MFVLARKPNQSIRIGNDIIVKILGYDYYGNIKIGIDAPKEINIVRSELLESEQ